MPWRFQRSPVSFWDDEANVRRYLSWVSAKLALKTLDDWYYVTVVQVQRLRGSSLLLKHGSLLALLSKYYPSHPWDAKKFAQTVNARIKWGKSQWFLLKFLKELIVNDSNNVKDSDIINNYKHPDLLFSDSSWRMELDIFIPPLNLAVEYQGMHHYEAHYVFGFSSKQQSKDGEKRQACSRLGITLVEVGYWWDHTKESLASTIQQLRPDILLNPHHAPTQQVDT
jgi:hypothetical protein